MSTARSRARTVHGRTPKTSTQLVDEMSTSKDFQSPDIFALRRRQAQVDAAKRGVSRLRRASVRMSDLPRVATLEATQAQTTRPLVSVPIVQAPYLLEAMMMTCMNMKKEIALL